MVQPKILFERDVDPRSNDPGGSDDLLNAIMVSNRKT